jgi:hypothetical protein
MTTDEKKKGGQVIWPTVGKRAGAGIHMKTLHHALNVITDRADPSLATRGWVGDETCLEPVDIGGYATVARPDIAAGRVERQTNQHYTL